MYINAYVWSVVHVYTILIPEHTRKPCMNAWIRAHIRTHTHTCIHRRASLLFNFGGKAKRTYTQGCCIHAFIHACTHIYTHTHTHTHTRQKSESALELWWRSEENVHSRLLHACIHTCMYAYTHTHTHTRRVSLLLNFGGKAKKTYILGCLAREIRPRRGGRLL